MNETDSRGRVVLLGSVFVVAACGLVYELVAGAVSSYLLGDAVTQFSLVIGVFLSSMGVGSFAAKFIEKDLLRRFVAIEITVGVIGGTSSIAMLATSAVAAPWFSVVFFPLCASIGILIGIEIPLLVRMLQSRGRVRDALSDVLALDYLGALAAAVLFPLVALPFLGIGRASVVFGILNLAVAGAGITLLPRPRRTITAALVVASLLLVSALAYSTRLVGFFEDLLYQDEVIYAADTPYQRIVLTRWNDDIRLFLNGHIQFSSIDEARYHEALVIPALTAADRPVNVLILGGGDGLAAREVLKFDSVRAVTIVDIDPRMTELGRTRPELVTINGDSMNDPRVRVVNDDAMRFLQSDDGFYDAILADLPDPNTQALAKLYSAEFYALIARRLSASGVLVTQATSPYFAPEAFASIERTVGAALDRGGSPERIFARGYHVHVPSFGDWGFVIGAKSEIDVSALSVSVPTRYLTDEVLAAMFVFGKDAPDADAAPVNHLEDPVLYRLYERGWRTFNE